MRQILLASFIFFLPLTHLAKTRRTGRLISVFNVIKFQNDPCVTQSVSSTGNRMGSCLTSSECTSRGGAGSGTCAAGFGSCCLFTANVCGSTISQNCTYIRNPGFPNQLTGTTACQYTIQKSNADICQFRLNFDSFSIAGVNVADRATEALGGMCDDTFIVNGLPGGRTVPTICGLNTGQHMILDVADPGASATLNFAFAAMVNAMRTWEIKVNQISCFDKHKSPDGCLQYHTGCTGMIMTFNFNGATGNHLASQCYSICIRQEEGMCCVKYQQCNANQFGLDNVGAAAKALTEASCLKDFIIIEGSSSDCCVGAGTLTNRYCGNVFSSSNLLMSPNQICDCTPPFEVGVVTDALVDAGGAGVGVGVCLKYTQTPCGIP